MTDDLARLAAWLPGQGLALAPASRLTRLGGGIANRNDAVSLATGRAVLRRPPPGALAIGASDMGREARVLAALAPHFPMAPRLLAYCDDAAVLGTPFLIIEHRQGVAIGGTMPPTAGPDAGNRLIGATLAQMLALHALSPAAVGLGDLGKPEGFYSRQLMGWSKRAAVVWPEALPPAATALIAALAAIDPPDGGQPALLHMDLKPDNLLVDPVTMLPQALIDWDMATRGPRGFELAVLLSYWIEPGDPAALHGLAVVPSLTPGWPARADIVRLYTVFGGRAAATNLGNLVWPVALARLRLAVAWGQLYRKWQRGEVTGDRYAGFEALAMAILDHALDQFTQGQT